MLACFFMIDKSFYENTADHKAQIAGKHSHCHSSQNIRRVMHIKELCI